MTAPDEQVRREAELARQLLAAADVERAQLYGTVYDEIYEMHLSRAGPSIEDQTYGASRAQLPMLERLTSNGDAVLEVGCGSGLLAIALGRAGRRVTGVEVSQVILDRAEHYGRGAAEFVRVSGTTLPFEDNQFDFAYSIQVLEHLHIRDALAHLKEVRRVTRGAYLVVTPNSRYEGSDAGSRWGVEADDDVHLHEWTYAELADAAREAGFARLRAIRNVARVQLIGGGMAKLLETTIRSRRLADRIGVSSINALLD